MNELSLEEIDRAIRTELTVPLWPHVGRILKMAKNTVYEGARTGEIPTIRVGRQRRVPTASLRKMLGLTIASADTDAAAPVKATHA